MNLKLCERGIVNIDNQQPRLLVKSLEKYDNDYVIYSDGRLYSNLSNRFVKGKIDNVGYRTYRLQKINPVTGKMGIMVYAHRLVAEAFLSNPNNLPYVHHKDENKTNNDVSNLEWVSAKKNMQYHNDIHKKKKREPRYKIKNLFGEKWLPLRDNPTYSVSNMGRVINNVTNRLLKLDKNQKYVRINLVENGKNKHYYLHRLVYCTFNNDYDLEGFVIDHIDNNPDNNQLSNLQKITFSENNYKRFNK